MERAFYRPAENRWFVESEPEFFWGWGGAGRGGEERRGEERISCL
jgi:hypothetical protein